MDQLFRYPLHQIPLVAMAIIIALSVHEFAHAYVAYKFGDDTAKRQGRLTLSPMAHLDPIGMIAVLILVLVGRDQFLLTHITLKDLVLQVY